jgi:hypothetical protein
MTVVDFVTDVLRQLAIISEIETPSAEQGQDAVTKLNELMASLELDGIKFGYNPKATTAENIVLPDGHKSAVKAMLGTMLCEGYGLPVPPLMSGMAKAGYDRMLRESLHQTMRESVSDSPSGENSRSRYNIETGA